MANNNEGGQKKKEKIKGRASKKDSTNKKSKNYKKPYNRQGR
jgi:hypothetical protein